MPTLEKKDAAGKAAGNVELDDAMFGIEPNVPVMHQVVTAQLAAKRVRHAVHQDPRRGARRRRQAVEAEGHRPRPCRLQPLADLGRRWRDPRPQAPRLRPAHPQEDDPPGAEVGPVRPGRHGSRSSCSTGASTPRAPRAPIAALAANGVEGRVLVVLRARGRGDLEEPPQPRPRPHLRRRRAQRLRRARVATGWSSPRTRSPSTVPSPGAPTRRRPREQGPPRHHPRPRRQREVLRPAPRAGPTPSRCTPSASKPEIHDAIESIFGVQGHQGEHPQPEGQAEAQPQDLRVRQPPRHQAGDRHPRRGPTIDLFQG